MKMYKIEMKIKFSEQKRLFSIVFDSFTIVFERETLFVILTDIFNLNFVY